VIDSGTRTTVYVESGNGVFEPCQVETGWRLGRRVEITAGLMPGDKVVVSGNFLIDSESRMKAAGSAADTGFADQSERHAGIDMPAMAEHDPSAMPDVDPVCRMYVNEKEARKAGRTARVAGKTYYFCSRECLDTFSGNPGKYVSGNRAVRKGEEQLAGPGLDRGLAAMPEARKARNSRSEGGSGKEDSKDAYGRAPTTPGIVDWGGPAKGTDTSAKRDWGSWGRFPGAEYLGLKEKTKDKTGRRSETAGTVQGKPAEDECAGHSHDDDTGKPDAAHGGAAPGASGGQADQ
jgi:YHS domain-containing protein